MMFQDIMYCFLMALCWSLAIFALGFGIPIYGQIRKDGGSKIMAIGAVVLAALVIAVMATGVRVFLYGIGVEVDEPTYIDTSGVPYGGSWHFGKTHPLMILTGALIASSPVIVVAVAAWIHDRRAGGAGHDYNPAHDAIIQEMRNNVRNLSSINGIRKPKKPRVIYASTRA